MVINVIDKGFNDRLERIADDISAVYSRHEARVKSIEARRQPVHGEKPQAGNTVLPLEDVVTLGNLAVELQKLRALRTLEYINGMNKDADSFCPAVFFKLRSEVDENRYGVSGEQREEREPAINMTASVLDKKCSLKGKAGCSTAVKYTSQAVALLNGDSKHVDSLYSKAMKGVVQSAEYEVLNRADTSSYLVFIVDGSNTVHKVKIKLGAPELHEGGPAINMTKRISEATPEQVRMIQEGELSGLVPESGAYNVVVYRTPVTGLRSADLAQVFSDRIGDTHIENNREVIVKAALRQMIGIGEEEDFSGLMKYGANAVILKAGPQGK